MKFIFHLICFILKICANEKCNNEITSKEKNAKYCSKSCSAKVNNKGKIRNKRNPDNYCSICGSRKSKYMKLCKKCTKETKLIKDFIYKNKKGSYQFNAIRKHAKKVMKQSGIECTCYLCDNNEFDEVVEVCHVRGITKFPLDTL